MTTTALALRTNTGPSLTRYIAEVNALPMVSHDEETELARRWRDFGDVEAAHRLVTANLRFVVKIAYEYKGYGLRILDIIQEGNIGLMQAVKRFDPDRGIRLISYAVYWIRAYIHKHLMDTWSVVKLGTTRAHRKLFYRLGKIRGLLGKTGEEHDDARKALAKEAAVSEQDVQDLENFVAQDAVRLDSPMPDGRARMDTLRTEGPNQEDLLGDAESGAIVQRRLAEALATLNDRERAIIQARYLSEQNESLRDVGERLELSGERVRQIEKRAMEKLKSALGPDFQMELLAA